MLSTCSTLLSLANTEKSQVIQFSHFSVKECLTSARFSETRNTISSRYHVSMTPIALVAKACLGILLHIDKDVSRPTLPKFPLAEYLQNTGSSMPLSRVCHKLQKKGCYRCLTGEHHIPRFGSGYAIRPSPSGSETNGQIYHWHPMEPHYTMLRFVVYLTL